jgi:hypothetical protein
MTQEILVMKHSSGGLCQLKITSIFCSPLSKSPDDAFHCHAKGMLDVGINRTRGTLGKQF